MTKDQWEVLSRGRVKKVVRNQHINKEAICIECITPAAIVYPYTAFVM